jgi:hypothetical protein
MEAITERIQWLHTIANGRWAPRWHEAIPLGGEHAHNAATSAARDAVMRVLEPMIEAAEHDLEAATEERDAFARG